MWGARMEVALLNSSPALETIKLKRAQVMEISVREGHGRLLAMLTADCTGRAVTVVMPPHSRVSDTLNSLFRGPTNRTAFVCTYHETLIEMSQQL